VIPSGQVMSSGRPPPHLRLIGRPRAIPAQSRHSGLVVMHRAHVAPEDWRPCRSAPIIDPALPAPAGDRNHRVRFDGKLCRKGQAAVGT
jgi:hypothetical protein